MGCLGALSRAGLRLVHEGAQHQNADRGHRSTGERQAPSDLQGHRCLEQDGHEGGLQDGAHVVEQHVAGEQLWAREAEALALRLLAEGGRQGVLPADAQTERQPAQRQLEGDGHVRRVHDASGYDCAHNGQGRRGNGGELAAGDVGERTEADLPYDDAYQRRGCGQALLRRAHLVMVDVLHDSHDQVDHLQVVAICEEASPADSDQTEGPQPVAVGRLVRVFVAQGRCLGRRGRHRFDDLLSRSHTLVVGKSPRGAGD
mmetsp:Transcript_47844/g.147524  ORF Transcript_47844/g.147524 Transcript_47844/m.147524 type:complete len:258 (-) Transcript_47844:12-785(-)